MTTDNNTGAPKGAPAFSYYTKHCLHCGSQNVLVPALVRWEPASQYWVIEDMPDGADSCLDCGTMPTKIESHEIYHNSKR